MLGEYVRPAGQPAWTSTLVGALGLLGVAEKAARQALARTAAEGWIASSRHGRLAQRELTAAGTRLLTGGAERIYSLGQDRPAWDGRWLVLLTGGPDAGRDRRQQLRTRLTWAGFGALPGGVWISPDPGREAEASVILAELGLAGECMSFIARSGDIGEPRDVVRRAWDLRGLRAGYAAFIADFAAAEPAGDDATFAACTMLVHQWRRFPFRGPAAAGQRCCRTAGRARRRRRFSPRGTGAGSPPRSAAGTGSAGASAAARAGVDQPVRCAVSLNVRTHHRSGVTMTRDTEALSAVLNANALAPLASASTCPITPPWVNAATRWPACPARMRPSEALIRPWNAASGSPPGITFQRSSANIRRASGWLSATILRYWPPSHAPRNTSRRPASTCGVSPRLAASGAAVWAVRRSVVT